MKKFAVRALALLMCAAMLMPMLPVPAKAADETQTELDISRGDIEIGEDTVSGVAADGTEVTTPNSAGYIITGTSGEYTVKVTGGTHSITLKDAAITSSAASPFDIQSGAVALTLVGTNTLTSNNSIDDCAGLHVALQAALTITGSGSLYAKSKNGAAGIGGNKYEPNGTITINGGTVTASGGSGIGCGYYHSRYVDTNAISGAITINGGIVEAVGTGGAGIGTASSSTDSNFVLSKITIAGGTVTATGRNNLGIGNWHDWADVIKWFSFTGGNVNAVYGYITGTNSEYLTSPAVYDLPQLAGKNLEIDSIVLSAGEWKTTDMQTIGGKLYLHLPAGVTVESVTIGNATFTPSADGSKELTCKHEGEEITSKTDNMDMTHTVTYKDCGAVETREHTYLDHVCTGCGFPEYEAYIVNAGSEGKRYFHTLATAVTEAKKTENAGCTLYLYRDVELSETLRIDSGRFTMDFTGGSLYGQEMGVGVDCLVISGNAEITVTGRDSNEGIFARASGTPAIRTENNASLTVTGSVRVESSSGAAVYANTPITISGGSFYTASSGQSLLALFHTDGESVVTGGEFRHGTEGPSCDTFFLGKESTMLSVQGGTYHGKLSVQTGNGVSNPGVKALLGSDCYVWDETGALVDTTGWNNAGEITANPYYTVTHGADLEHAVITMPDRTHYYIGGHIEGAVVTIGGVELTENTHYTIKYEDNTDPGEATITVTGKAPYTGEKTATFTIAPHPLAISFSDSGLFYTGEPQEPVLSVRTKTDVVGYTFDTNNLTVEYKPRDADSAYSATKPSAVGEYTARISLTEADGGRHVLDGADDDGYVYLNFSIKWWNPGSSAPIYDTAEVPGSGGWYTSYGLNAGANYILSLSEPGEYGASLTIPDGDYSENPIRVYFKSTINRWIGYRELSPKVDSIAPAAEIELADQEWTQRLNEIFFGLFFKRTQTVTINTTDETSGVAAVEYALTEGTAAPDDGEWEDYTGTFSIDPNKKFTVWARVTDHAGNVTVVNSNGVVLYTDSTTEVTGLTYTLATNESLSLQVITQGNTLNHAELGSEFIPADSYTWDDAAGTFTLTAAYLETLAAGDHELTLHFDPLGEAFVVEHGNEAPVPVAVPLRVEKYSTAITITAADAGYNAEAYAGAQYSADTGTESVTPVVEYRLRDEDDSAYTENVPVDVGDYTLRVTVPESGKQKGAVKTADFAITPAPLTVSGVTVEGEKPYDGTVDITVTDHGVLAGTIWLSDSVELDTSAASAVYDDADAGTDIPVICTGWALKGDDAANYALTQPQGLTADIAPLDMQDAVVTTGGTRFAEDGGTHTLTITSAKVNGLEATYTLSGESADSAGVFAALLTGTGNFTGTLPVTWVITPDTSVMDGLTTGNVTLEGKMAVESLHGTLARMLTVSTLPEDLRQEYQALMDRLDGGIMETLEQLHSIAQGKADRAAEVIAELPAEPDMADAGQLALLETLYDTYGTLTVYEYGLLTPEEHEAADAFVSAMTAYRIISGDNAKWYKGAGSGLTFTANGDFGKFSGLALNSRELEPSAYEAKAGSTVVTLYASYLQTLAPGTYELSVIYTDGSTSGTFTVSDTGPATGDESRLLLWTGVFLLAAGGAAGLAFRGRKRRSETK